MVESITLKLKNPFYKSSGGTIKVATKEQIALWSEEEKDTSVDKKK